jgi:hypothetical protein
MKAGGSGQQVDAMKKAKLECFLQPKEALA